MGLQGCMVKTYRMYHFYVRVKSSTLGDRALRSSGERQYRLDTNARLSANQNIWPMMLVGVTAGLLSMYFIVARPMLSQIGHLQTELVAVQQDMDKLVGAKTNAWQVNNLLTVLKFSGQTTLRRPDRCRRDPGPEDLA